MPTPSAPESSAPFTFSSTCPEPEGPPSSHPQPHDTHTDNPVRLDYSPPTDRDGPSASGTTSPAPQQGGNDERTHDSDAHTSSPLLDNEPCGGAHSMADPSLDPTYSPYDPSPIERVQSTSPRHGVGTPRLSTSHVNMDGASMTSHGRGEYAMEEDYSLPSMGLGYPNKRAIPTYPSSFLRAGSRFIGTQQSERQVYNVQVEIKYVDLRESFLGGYLRIQGLTDEHPTLTTYFEGEIIGPKYGFMTKHDAWGASDKTDISHWSKFAAFRPYAKQARRGSSVVIKDVAQSEHIFMRWKEHFLVPDHRVRTITGASFEGFYYICFNQVLGEVNGIYFHSKSERFQQLELKRVEDRGCYNSLEFR